MPLYEYAENAKNKVAVDSETVNNITIGTVEFTDRLCSLIQNTYKERSNPCIFAFDGNYCVAWDTIINNIKNVFSACGFDYKFIHINTVFEADDFITNYKKPFLTEDPSLGYENRDGRVQDIMDMNKVSKLNDYLVKAKSTIVECPMAIIVYAPASAIAELHCGYDYKFYFDMPKDPIMWNLWGGTLIPFGRYEPDPAYIWKDLYYNDFNLLDKQKWYLFENMDFYVSAVDTDNLTLIPRREYDILITSLLRYPVKQVKVFMPGPFGAYRFKQLWDVPGLDNSAWNNISSPKLDLIIEIGEEKEIRLPSVNLLQYGDRFVGPYWDKEVPKWWPLLAAIDDGYFPDSDTPLERTAMCQHNHPSTEYVRRNFNEQFGRYETYYILEAYEKSATIMGFQEDANIDEWQEKCWKAAETKSLIPDWKNYVKIWNTAPGDLFLIPPGTTHGHGGRQMVLELDTNVNTTTCEYSFYMHDYGRNSWDDKTKTMTGKKCNLQCRHGFNIDQSRRENWVRDHLRARPQVIKWTPEYSIEQYTTLPEMPFHIERFHFAHRAENDTQGKFMNVVTLTIGESITIRSKSNPEYQTTLDNLQAATIPASYGEYEFINNGKGQCTVVQIRMKKG